MQVYPRNPEYPLQKLSYTHPPPLQIPCPMPIGYDQNQIGLARRPQSDANNVGITGKVTS